MASYSVVQLRIAQQTTWLQIRTHSPTQKVLQCSQQLSLQKGLPKSTTCPSSNYTHCSQLLCSSTGWLPTATTVQWRTKWPPEQCSSEISSCCRRSHQRCWWSHQCWQRCWLRKDKEDWSQHQFVTWYVLHAVQQCVPLFMSRQCSLKTMKM